MGEVKALSFAIKTGKDDQLYELSFYEPMFLRNDLGFGLNLSLKGYKSAKCCLRYRKFKISTIYCIFPLGEKSKIKIEYSISQTDLSNPGNVGSIITNEVNEGKVTSSSIGYVLFT